MKRLVLVMFLGSIVGITPAHACGEGQGNAIEVNATTKEVRTYCYDIVQRSQADLEAEARQRIEQTLSNQANANPITKISESTVNVTELANNPDQRPRVLEVNATTGVTIERDFTDAELDQWRIDRTNWQASNEALEIAKSNTSPGVRNCVDWMGITSSGSSCYYEPVIVSQEEIDNEYNFLVELFSHDWFAMLKAWLG